MSKVRLDFIDIRVWVTQLKTCDQKQAYADIGSKHTHTLINVQIHTDTLIHTSTFKISIHTLIKTCTQTHIHTHTHA